MKNPSRYLLFTALFLLIIAGFAPAAQSQDDDAWKNNWGVESGFAIEKDTDGYFLPSGIAFVPNPGNGPKDPLYFVIELRGTIKVVTNDRTVSIFAEEFFRIDPDRGLAEYTDEYGMAGICLDPASGYIFVTYSYQTSNNKLKNSISRFATKPGTFSVSPQNVIDFRNPFLPFLTDASHQIGSCRVYQDQLYVTVGDGLNQEEPPIALESLRGKVLRFSLDGEPADTNPYYDTQDQSASVNYVWATGFRNPFALEIVDGQVFVADNGSSIDRFLHVEEGHDYLWNGEDWSIGSTADIVFSPSIGPTHLQYIPPSTNLLTDEYAGNFFVSATGGRIRGLINIHYDLASYSAVQPPTIFLRYIGASEIYHSGIVTGLALGPDGLYFAPMTEAGVESGAVYRIYFDPENEHPLRPEDVSNPEVLLSTKQCLACHSLYGEGSTFAQQLDYEVLIPSIEQHINSEDYLQSLDEVDKLDTQPYTDFSEARNDIRANTDLERLRIWVYYHLLEPKFDNPESQMPNVGLTKDQAEIIMNFLLTEPDINISEDSSQNGIAPESSAEPGGTSGLQSTNPLVRMVATVIPVVGYRHLVIFFVVGVFAGLALILVIRKVRDRNN